MAALRRAAMPIIAEARAATSAFCSSAPRAPAAARALSMASFWPATVWSRLCSAARRVAISRRRAARSLSVSPAGAGAAVGRAPWARAGRARASSASSRPRRSAIVESGTAGRSARAAVAGGAHALVEVVQPRIELALGSVDGGCDIDGRSRRGGGRSAWPAPHRARLLGPVGQGKEGSGQHDHGGDQGDHEGADHAQPATDRHGRRRRRDDGGDAGMSLMTSGPCTPAPCTPDPCTPDGAGGDLVEHRLAGRPRRLHDRLEGQRLERLGGVGAGWRWR